MSRATLAAVALFVISACVAAGGSPLVTAQQQFEAGHFSLAIATLQDAIRSSSSDGALYFWLARCYFELRNFRDATKQYEQAVKIDPDNSDYHLWLGRTYGRQAEDGHSFWMAMKSRKELEEAVRLNTRNIPARRDLAEFYSEAPWIVGGSKKKARDEIATIAALDSIQGALALAEYDRKNGDPAGAEAAYRQALDAKPPRADEYYEVADYYARAGNVTVMQEAVDGASSVSPNDPRLGYYRGVILATEGQQLGEAESYLKAYLAATPDRSDYPSHADARTWLGHVYEKMGKRLEAAEQYRAALEINPDSDFAKQSLKQLEK